MNLYSVNDQKDDRQGVSSSLSQRALREIYLMPFMIAEKYAKPWLDCVGVSSLRRHHNSDVPPDKTK